MVVLYCHQGWRRMKEALIEGCINYLKFGYDFDGVDFPEMDEELFRKILEGDESADDIISSFITAHSLDVKYDASFDEIGRYPDSRCLVNYFNIRDRAKLKKIEIFISSVRILDLFLNPIDMGFSFDYLKALHNKIFGDIYPSAGMIRNKDESKRSEYCKSIYLEKMASDIFDKLRNAKFLRGLDDIDEFINELAYYMGEMEALHPFMDGNGRTTRYFFTDLARKAGYDIIWSATDPDRYLEGNIAAIDGDYQPLVDVLEEAVIPIVED